jgi:hypothetical protein
MLRRESIHGIFTWRELSSTHCGNPGERRVDAERIRGVETRSGHRYAPDFAVHYCRRNYLASDSNCENVIGRAFLPRLIGFTDDFAKLANVIHRLSELELRERLIGNHWRNGYAARVHDRRIRVRSDLPRRRLGGVDWQYNTLVTLARGEKEHDTQQEVPHHINLRKGEGPEEEETKEPDRLLPIRGEWMTDGSLVFHLKSLNL